MSWSIVLADNVGVGAPIQKELDAISSVIVKIGKISFCIELGLAMR